MSATGRAIASGSDALVRHPDDFYKTPAWCTRAILPHLRTPRLVLDPACGDGAILRELAVFWPAVTRFGLEIDEGRAATARAFGEVFVGDALGPRSWGDPDLIVGNPPFALAIEFVQRSLEEVADDGQVAMLLRLPWLASMGRSRFLRANTPSVNVLPRRPEFAASIRCAGKGDGKVKTKCGYGEMLPIDAPRPHACPGCGAPVTCSTTDATDYAWFVWDRAGLAPTVRILDVEAHVRGGR